jgi:hypothetical protein
VRGRGLEAYSFSTGFPFSQKDIIENKGEPFQVLSVIVITPLQFEDSHVRGRGLEPPCLTAPVPKTGVATNYTTRAFVIYYS